MLNEDALREALAHAEIPPAPVRYEEVVDSTNAVALRMAAEGAPEWTVVAAGHQTAGRGRLGRRWESTSGQSLLFSFVLRPTLPAGTPPLITLLAGAALVDACGDSGVRTRCKWPNDILLGDAKAGGILAEARVTGDRFDYVVVGVGVNVGTVPPEVEGAASLAPIPPGDLLGSFFAEFWSTYRYAGPERFVRRVLERYRPHCATLGLRVRGLTTRGEMVEGAAEDVDESGSLVVRTETGLETVGFGEVEHLR